MHVLSVRINDKVATLHGVVAGSPEFVSYLQKNRIEALSVDLASDWEQTLFVLRRNWVGEWIAIKQGIRQEIPIGTAERVTIETILAIDDQFKQLRERQERLGLVVRFCNWMRRQ